MVQADSPSYWLPCTTPSTKHTESVVRSTACLRVVLGHMLVAIPKGETFFLFVTGQCPDLPNAHMFDFDSCLIIGPPGSCHQTQRRALFVPAVSQGFRMLIPGHGNQEMLEDWQRTQQIMSLFAVNLLSKHSFYEPSSPETMYQY